jgi:uncharacterized protein DUF4019
MLRSSLRLIAALCLACAAVTALAQDPRTVAVQTAARAWLALIDKGDAQGAWNAAGKKFQGSMPASAWAAELKKAQDKIGPATQRTVGPTRFESTFPGLPDGDYAQILFRTAFSKKQDGGEQLTLEREADGQWRVVGYFPR